MKNRLIVAAIGIPALLAVIFFTPIWGWGIVVAIMAAFCAWELLHTAMPKFVPRFAVYAGVCGAAIVLGAAFGKSELVFKIAAYVLFVTMFVEMMISFHKSERIPVEKGGKKILIGIDKIRFVMARDDYAYLQTDTDRYFSTVSLAQLEKRLDGHGFFRVHRGYLVNLSMVEEIEPVAGGTLLLTLNGVEEKIPVSRRRVSALKKALGL